MLCLLLRYLDAFAQTYCVVITGLSLPHPYCICIAEPLFCMDATNKQCASEQLNSIHPLPRINVSQVLSNITDNCIWDGTSKRKTQYVLLVSLECVSEDRLDNARLYKTTRKVVLAPSITLKEEQRNKTTVLV
jgi:hypothetical protein